MVFYDKYAIFSFIFVCHQMNGASQNTTLTLIVLCPFLPLYANLMSGIFIEMVIGPLKSHVFESRV